MDFVGYLTSAGIDESMVFLLLAIPYISFIIGFFRQFLGIKTFGMYEPLVIAFALYAISPSFVTGLKYGIPILIVAWIASEVMRRLLNKRRLHFISKVSFKLSIASLLMLGLLALAAFLNKAGFFGINPLAIVIILTLVESISLFQVKRGDPYTNLVTIETLIVSLISYFVLTSSTIRDFVLQNYYFVIVPIVANFIVGRWRGLRLSEFIRFRNILKND